MEIKKKEKENGKYEIRNRTEYRNKIFPSSMLISCSVGHNTTAGRKTKFSL
jgi:hypothetical protein